MKVDLAETVPREPSVENEDSISVVFKLPNGARVERRFLRTNSLKVRVVSYISIISITKNKSSTGCLQLHFLSSFVS